MANMNEPTLFGRPEKKKRERPRDEIWDTLAELFYPDGVADVHRGVLREAVKQLRQIHASPPEIRRRFANYISSKPTCTWGCTPPALVKHWSLPNVRGKPVRPFREPMVEPPKPKPLASPEFRRRIARETIERLHGKRTNHGHRPSEQ